MTPNEKALIACVLSDPRCLSDVGGLDPGYFMEAVDGKAWEAIVALDARNGTITHISVAQELKDRAAVDRLASCLSVDVHPTQAGWYADRVADDSLGRSLRRTLATFETELKSDATSNAEALADLTEALEHIRRPPPRRANLRDMLVPALDRWLTFSLQPEDHRSRGCIETGFRLYDKMAGGLKLGQLHILGGDTSSGKSSLANAIIYNACRRGAKVDLYGYEDEPGAVLARIAARHANLNNFNLQFDDLSGADPDLVSEKVSELHRFLDVEVQDDRPRSVADLCLQIREGVARRGTRLVVIDYVQLLKRLGEGRTAHERLAHLTDELFYTARRSGAAILLLSQLKRGERQTTDKRPTKFDLKDCGDLEQQAFTVALLWNRKVEQTVACGTRDRKEVLPVVELILDKNKNGGLGSDLLEFRAKPTTFYDLDPHSEMWGDYKAVTRD